jgi:hypothetical protein
VSPGGIARLPSGVLKPERTHEFGEFEHLGAHHARLVLGMLRETRVLKVIASICFTASLN